jgi:hypothetical protein
MHIVYVKGHTVQGDGGAGCFLWRTNSHFQTGPYSIENYGTIVKSDLVPIFYGSWVRQYDGDINVLFFGSLPWLSDYAVNFQRAIDFASLNANLSILKGSTVYIPNGSYHLSHVILKNGVNVFGESLDDTIIYALPGNDDEYMFEMEAGLVKINIGNLNLSGQSTLRGAFYFQAVFSPSPPLLDGLQNSTMNYLDPRVRGIKTI